MNQEVGNALANNAHEVEFEDVDIEIESDDESDVDLDESEDEYFEEINSEILEAVNRNTEHLQLLHKSFSNVKLELFDIKGVWFRRFFKEIEMAHDTVEQIEEELFELPD